MTDVFATRRDWLVKTEELEGYDILTIHPLQGLTARMVVHALTVQKLLYECDGQPAFVIREHGSKILIQRSRPDRPAVKLTAPQTEFLQAAAAHPLGLTQDSTNNGLGASARRRMAKRLEELGLLREYPHGGHEITVAGRKAAARAAAAR